MNHMSMDIFFFFFEKRTDTFIINIFPLIYKSYDGLFWKRIIEQQGKNIKKDDIVIF